MQRIASGLCALVIAVGCKGRDPTPPPAQPPAGSGSASAPVPPPPPIDAATPAPSPLDAPLADATKDERTMVTTWFAKLNGIGPLAIKGVDHDPFRKTHAGVTIDDATKIQRAAAPTDRGATESDKRTFFLSELADGAGKRSAARIVMTFDTKGALVGISY